MIRFMKQKLRRLFKPGNVIRLRQLDRDWQETDVLMEEAVFQLLLDFFQQEQPFHGAAREKNPCFARHRELLESDICATSKEEYATWRRLLEIAEWYATGGLQDPARVYAGFASLKYDVNECVKEEQRYIDLVTSNLLFVITHRRKLWT